MKAVIINDFGGPEQLIYTDVPKPEPKGDEILVRNQVIGVGKPDFLVRSGNDPYLAKNLPGLIVGNESSGIVEAVGPDATDFKPGDHVALLNGTGCGSHAEYSCGRQGFAIKLPDDIPFKDMAGILNLQVAYALIHDAAKGTDGESIYISGAAGGIGTVLIQIAKAAGMKVYCGASTERKCDVLRQIGAERVINTSEEDVAKVILECTSNRGVDVIFDQLAGPDFSNQFEYLADFGMILLYNWMKGSPELDQLATINKQAPHASAIRAFSYHVFDNKPERRRQNAEACFNLIREGKVKPFIYDDLPLSEARTAHELLDGGEIIGKLIMHP